MTRPDARAKEEEDRDYDDGNMRGKCPVKGRMCALAGIARFSEIERGAFISSCTFRERKTNEKAFGKFLQGREGEIFPWERGGGGSEGNEPKDRQTELASDSSIKRSAAKAAAAGRSLKQCTNAIRISSSLHQQRRPRKIQKMPEIEKPVLCVTYVNFNS